MRHPHTVFALSMALAAIAAGCGSRPAADSPTNGQVFTVFDLALNGLDSREARPATRDPAGQVPVDVRVVVNEGSGDVTLAARR